MGLPYMPPHQPASQPPLAFSRHSDMAVTDGGRVWVIYEDPLTWTLRFRGVLSGSTPHGSGRKRLPVGVFTHVGIEF